MFSVLAIYNNESLLNSIIFAKLGYFFAQNKISPPKIAKVFQKFTKVAKFRQIWSH